MEKQSLQRIAFVIALALATTSALHAQDKPAQPASSTQSAAENAAQAENPVERAWHAAAAVAQHGPQTIALTDQAKLDLPQGFAFVPAREGRAAMEAMGNSIGDAFLGLIVPIGDNDAQEWIATLDYEPSGYIKDDDAKHWKSDELLSELKEGTEAGNERRQRMGFAPLEVTRWIETPAYDDATQRLVWSVELREKSAAANDDNTVNYNTYVLGREGYVSLDFITSESHIDAEKPVARRLLSAITFKDGKRYADFDAKTDHIAEYGLAALIGGIAAKKLGLLAMAGVLFAKFFKLIAVGAVAIGAALRKFFAGRKAG